jgi:hypothetical protein
MGQSGFVLKDLQHPIFEATDIGTASFPPVLDYHFDFCSPA